MKQVYFNIAYSNMIESSLLLTGKKYVSLITDYIKQNTNWMISSFSIVYFASNWFALKGSCQ